jgi:hypothetical protein
MIIFIYLFIGGTEVLNQGIPFAKQVFYHLSHTSSPFGSGYSEMGSCKLWPHTEILLVLASQVTKITGMSHWHPADKNLLNRHMHFCISDT